MESTSNGTVRLVIVRRGGEVVQQLANQLAEAAARDGAFDVALAASEDEVRAALSARDDGSTPVALWVGERVEGDCCGSRVATVEDDGGGETVDLSELQDDGGAVPLAAVLRLSPTWGQVEVLEPERWPAELGFELYRMGSTLVPPAGGIGVEMPPINGLINAASPTDPPDRSFGVWQIRDGSNTPIGHMLRSTGTGTLNGIPKGKDIWSFSSSVGLWPDPFELVPYPNAVNLSSGDVMDATQHSWLDVKEQRFYTTSPAPTTLSLSGITAVYSFEIYRPPATPTGATHGWMVVAPTRTKWYIPSTTAVSAGRLDVTTSDRLKYTKVTTSGSSVAFPFAVAKFCYNAV